MPKANNLADIYHLIEANEPVSSPHHFLFLLGTDTKFTTNPTAPQKFYERGETLSYAAQTMVSLLGESSVAETYPSEPLSFCSPSVDVVNGPSTLGADVGERIAQAIFLALRAVASGKTTLQITAHSRGAVEATLLMHELARIKRALANNTLHKSLKQILLESPCALTRTAVGKLFPTEIIDTSVEHEELLSQRLHALKINAFLIDPVPGDSVFALPGIRWHDDRFYEEAPCNRSELLLCRDERTSCFYPIVPKGMQPLIIPGHHGTATGNRYSQQYAELPANLRHHKTTDVQDLVLCKLLSFLHQTTGIVSQPPSPLNLGHRELDEVVNTYLAATELQRKELILEKYLNIQANAPAYRSFATTSYAFLGTSALNNSRYVHYRRQEYMSMASFSPEMKSGFVNTEHALLYLSKHIDFSQVHHAESDMQVTAITNTLEKIISEMKRTDEESPLLSLISKEDLGSDGFFNGLSIMVDLISQKYLRNHLSADEKARLLAVINGPFIILSDAKSSGRLSEEHSQIIEQCESILQDGVKQTLEAHYTSIIQQSDQIDVQIRRFLDPIERFTETFHAYLQGLAIEDTADDTHNERDESDFEVVLTHKLARSLHEIKQRLSELNPVTIDTVQQALSTESAQIQLNGDLNPRQKERLTATLLDGQCASLRAYFEAHLCTVEEHLSSMDQLHDTAERLQKIYPQLLKLVGEKKLDIDQQQLDFHINRIVKLAGILLKEKNYNLRNQPESVSEAFYNLAKNQAIAFGAPSPELDGLQQEMSAQKTVMSVLQPTQRAMIQKLTTTNLEKDTRIDALTTQNTAKDVTIDTLTTQNIAKDATIGTLTTQNTAKDVTISTLTAQNTTKDVAIDTLTAQNTEKDRTILALTNQKNRLASSTEITHAFFIEKKLIPVTKNYLHHLLVQARKHNPTLNINETYPQMLPESTNMATKDAYDKIKIKFNRVQDLYQALVDKDVLPGQRIINFKTTLNTHKKDIKLHRDPAWQIFVKSCLDIIAILATGVIPVVLYSKLTGHTPFFFSQSMGEKYITDCSNLTASEKQPQYL